VPTRIVMSEAEQALIKKLFERGESCGSISRTLGKTSAVIAAQLRKMELSTPGMVQRAAAKSLPAVNVPLPALTRKLLEQAAARRRLTPAQLAADLLSAIVRKGSIDATLRVLENVSADGIPLRSRVELDAASNSNGPIAS